MKHPPGSPCLPQFKDNVWVLKIHHLVLPHYYPSPSPLSGKADHPYPLLTHLDQSDSAHRILPTLSHICTKHILPNNISQISHLNMKYMIPNNLLQIPHKNTKYNTPTPRGKIFHPNPLLIYMDQSHPGTHRESCKHPNTNCVISAIF